MSIKGFKESLEQIQSILEEKDKQSKSGDLKPEKGLFAPIKPFDHTSDPFKVNKSEDEQKEYEEIVAYRQALNEITYLLGKGGRK